MKRKFIFLLLLILFNVGHAQFLNNEDSLKSGLEEPIETKRGYFQLDEVPISVNVPLNFFFLDRESTEYILIDCWGNSVDQVSNVIGMLIPDTTSYVAYIDKAFILSYRKVGHVNDDNMRKFSFSKFLKSIQESVKNQQQTIIEWAWPPKYDTNNHHISIPLLAITNSQDSILHARSTIFGKDAVIEVEPIIAPSDIKWAEFNEDLILNSVSFNSGYTYSDFDKNVESDTYLSVLAYLYNEPISQPNKGQTANTETLLPHGWLVTFGSLIGLIIVLYVASLITNASDDEKNSITKAGTNVLFRIGVFMSVYVLSIVIGIYTLWVGVKISIWSTSELSFNTICLLICIWLVLGTFAIFLIKPLFQFTANKDNGRHQIKRNDAPQLFKLIEDTATQAHVSMPKKVFLSSRVNACVFYNTTFWNIFFPVRKNIEVGIGLLQGTNQSELKAVIAHEFGHFAQHSMKIGSIVSIGYELASNMVSRKDWLDEWLVKWQLSNIYWIISLFGSLAAKSIGGIRSVISQVYLFVQKGYMGLSRQMEYEADKVSCNTVGSTACISALCKIDIISNKVDAYNSLLAGIAESRQILPSSYWNGYNLFLKFSNSFDGKVINPNVILLEPESSKQHSKIELKNPWISHPTLQQRISHILSNDINQDINTDSALSLIPIALINAISDSVFENADYATYKRANDDEYVSLLSSEIEERSFAIDVRPFFNRDICPFNPHEIKPEDGEIKSPLNEDNAKFVMEYEQAIADYRTMMQFKNKQIKGKVIRYEGKVYNRKNMPIDQQAEYLRLLNNKVKTIDMLVCRYALTVVENRALIIKAYDDIFYSQYIIEKIKNNLFSNRAALTRDLSRIKRRDENDFLELQRNLISFKKSIMDAIANIEMDRLRPVAHVDMWKKFSYFMKTETIFAGSSILSEEINYVFSIPDELIQLFENLEYYSKKIISDCMSGKEPLMAWDNSVSAQNNKSE